MEHSATPILELHNITKEFSSIRVLNRVSFSINTGEIMGLIGENGAGKSTLIKIISGIYQPTEGTIHFQGQHVVIPDYITAKKLGIAIVPQEFNLINTLSVYENIFLGNEIRLSSGILDKKTMRDLASKQLEELNMSLSVSKLVKDLSVAEKQMVEISKALLLNARFLIMDEPTTTLTGREISTLFRIMRRLKQQGVTIIFVSHKLQEIQEICDRVTVLRDGELISVDDIHNVNEQDMARKMIGRDFQQVFPPKRPVNFIDPVLQVKHISIPGLLHNISFELYRGEILGFAGLVGSGRTETAEAIMGIRKIQSGEIYINGKPIVIRNPKDAVKAGLGYLSEDRQGKGIVMDFSIPQNISLIALQKFIKYALIDKQAERRTAETYIQRFKISSASKTAPLKFLSGGNQQKVYLGRWVETSPSILILDEPTRGIDVNAKREIYEFIHHLAESNISCIVISSEMEELIGLCNRLYVMKEGTISGELSGEHINEEEIMFLATGIKERSA
ncbi:MAG: sugar ABC transporter ATP-binding protein [Treponema sp.]|nr:sugar ABC transporter ATP-binding protein [Treponema sp.]